MGAMKSFLAILTLLIGVSVACSAYKSAGSQSLVNSNSAVAQSPAQPNNASGQDKLPCTLTVDQAPDIKGLKLRMTTEEVLALFPGSKDDAEVRSSLSRPPSQFGESSFAITPDRYESKDKFAGISRITFTLLDGRVSTLYVGYNGPEYSHVDKFVAKFSEGTNLPTGAWEPYVGMDNNLKILKCADFEIRVFTGGKGGSLNYVRVHDLEAEKKLNERQKKAEEKATPQP
jgi:hypothetical protein